jgi:hypothetical protein
MIAVMIRVLLTALAVWCLSGCPPLDIASGLHGVVCGDLDCGISIPKARPICPPGKPPTRLAALVVPFEGLALAK